MELGALSRDNVGTNGASREGLIEGSRSGALSGRGAARGRRCSFIKRLFVRGDSRGSFQPGEGHCGEADPYLRDVSVSRLSAGFSRWYLNKKSRGREITGGARARVPIRIDFYRGLAARDVTPP